MVNCKDRIIGESAISPHLQYTVLPSSKDVTVRLAGAILESHLGFVFAAAI